ncbi:hypothetical protein RHMOL_Rhmol05G0026600 [Rhododendron molle]|uniref:Uncharacterized protein n=1 Tax=Rhododendron molle TaxID=49168 RepID=A0ACC0NKQ9_RHOML|nr:hypothetical protein RHMOL_Rhmol05G0026600 [Rhododendron molle]
MACGINSSISLEDLRQCFGHKRKDAAESLGGTILLAIYISLGFNFQPYLLCHQKLDYCLVEEYENTDFLRFFAHAVSVSTFKRACRQHGIKRWPNRIGSNVRKTPDPHERNTSPTCKTTSSHGQTEMGNQMVGHLHEPNEHLSDFFDGPVFWNTESSVAGILESPTFHDAGAGNYLDMDFTFSSVFKESEEPRGQQTDQSTLSAPCLEGHGSRSSYGIVVPACSDPASTQPMPIISHPMPTTPPLTQSQDISSVTVKATYEDNTIKIQLPLTSGIIELKEEVAMRLKLELDSFNLKPLFDLIDNYGRILRFNTIDFTMTDGFKVEKVHKFGIEEKGTYFLQCNKEIIRVSSTTSTGRLMPYTRFCVNGFAEAAWEVLGDDEIRGKSWFLSNFGAKFSSAAEGTAVERVHFLSRFSRRASYCLFSCDLNSPGKDAHSYFGNLSKRSTVWINVG